MTTCAAGCLALTGVVFAQADQPSGQRSGQSDQSSQSGQSSGQSGQAGQSGAGGAQASADAQAKIDRLLADIAKDPKTSADKLFILQSALQTKSEIELAKQVAQKSQNAAVKKMAQQMQQSLTQQWQQLQQTAQAIGLELPQELAQAQVAEVNIVAALPADQIDQQYLSQVQTDNAEDLARYQSQSQVAQDPRVKQFAQQQVAQAQKRSQDANQVAQGIGMQGEAQPAGARIQGSGGAGSSSSSGSGAGQQSR
jgi:predicted outer membrane protein